MTDDEFLMQLGRLIRASEIRVSARIQTVLSLTGAGFDTTEAEITMWRELEALTALRRQKLRIDPSGQL
ncbi:hypothetical protein [Methylorubrum suomiense]|uniref:Uncharacterized protein n=1 Tax=Methylorubrum suomiense TaxID=144191 RepID=A0ABQ4V357_9HYPH|nr:hypothetical protein [Methylorubrum suomiense]GJE78479.1 hypothetical protein BGCPKDLD_5095 [Methylorubrum suomiense]